MAPHSSAPAWKIPWTEEPGGLKSMGSPRVGHDWATSLALFTLMHWRRQWQPTPVLLPGRSHGRGSLVGCRLLGRTESDTTEATQQQQQQQQMILNLPSLELPRMYFLTSCLYTHFCLHPQQSTWEIMEITSLSTYSDGLENYKSILTPLSPFAHKPTHYSLLTNISSIAKHNLY